MKYEEFRDRLAQLKEEFCSVHGRYPLTMAEFEDYLSKKKTGSVRAVRLRSLKGLDI